MTSKQVSLPLALVVGICTTVAAAAGSAAVVRRDVDHIGSRVERVERKVDAVEEAMQQQQMRSARDDEWQRTVERQLTDIGNDVRQINAQLRQRRRR